MSDVKVEENRPKLEDVTMEDASTSNVKTEDTKPSTATVSSSTQVPATEEFAPQKGEDGELIIKDLPETLKGKSEEEVAEVKKAIVEQVEFYFSDSNFPYDKFLYTIASRTPEGFVDLNTLCSFKRMKVPYTSVYGVDFIRACLRERMVSKGEEVLVALSEDGKEVRRNKALVKDSSAWERTLYVKGFGTGSTEHNSQEQLEAFFKPYGKINALRMRREDNRSRNAQQPRGSAKDTKKEDGEVKEESAAKVEAGSEEKKTEAGEPAQERVGLGEFKGSVFVEFKELGDAKRLAELDPKPEFHGETLLIMFKEEYAVKKAIEKGVDPSTIQRTTGAGGGQNNAKHKFNAFHLKNGPQVGGNGRDKRKRDDDDEGEGGAGKKDKKPVFLYIEYLGKKLAVDRATSSLADADELDYPKQTVLKFSNLPEDGDWKELKTSLADGGFVETFMSYPKGAAAGSLCMKSNEPISDDDVEKIKGLKLALGDKVVDWRRATDEEEKSFWLTRANFQASQAVKRAEIEDAEKAQANEEAMKDGKRGGGGRGSGRGGRGRGGGRGGGRGRGNRGRGKRD